MIKVNSDWSKCPLSSAECQATHVHTNMTTQRQPCRCGCGEFPKMRTSQWRPGHDLKERMKPYAMKKEGGK